MVIKVHDLLAEISRLKAQNVALSEKERLMSVYVAKTNDEFYHKSTTTLLLELRNSGKAHHDESYRAKAFATADSLDIAIKLFAKNPTYVNLSEVNSRWAQAHRLLTKLQPTNAPSDQGGALQEGARLAA